MKEHQRVVEQEVRELLEGAGPRAVVPAEDLAAIRAVARDEWRELVRSEGRRRQSLRLRGGLALAASVVLALVAGWWWSTRTAPTAPVVVAGVELLKGEVRFWEPGAESPVALAVGGQLPAGASLETMGWGGESPARLALRLSDGQSVRLDAGTRVRLVSARRLELERGALYVDSGAAPYEGGAVEVVTSFGIVRDIGTQFEVRLSVSDTAVRVRVREGKVSLDADGESHLAADGEQLSLQSDGSVARADIEPYGPEWTWVVAAAPSPAIEGQTFESFLEWFGRETGRRIRYEDEELERLAATIDLHGPSEGLTLEEALEKLVLPSSALDYRVENGSILISRVPPAQATR